MRAFIIEDNFQVRDTLILMLKKYSPEVSVVGTAGDYTSALTQLLPIMDNIDILFCDIELPSGKSGFDLLEKLNNKNWNVVFVSGHEEFALKAFQYEAVNFITKPISSHDLVSTIQRIRRRLHKDAEAAPKQALVEKLALFSKGQWNLIDVSSVIFIKAKGCYSIFYIKDQEHPIVTCHKLNYYGEKLKDVSSFLRVQKSYIININEIASIMKSRNILQMNGDYQIPIGGGAYREKVNKILSHDGI